MLFALSELAHAEIAINALGFSHHFGEHPEVVNEKHDMIGVEYSGVGYAHFRDSYGYKNNALMYHWRTDLSANFRAGVTAAYVHRYRPAVGLAPELIAHIEGVGIRVICLPGYKDRIGFCAFNARIAIP